MARLHISGALALAGALLLAACGGQQPQERPFQTTPIPATAYPAPASPAADSSYPAPAASADSGYPAPAATADPADPSYQGRDLSALASYTVALEYAQGEFGDVKLYTIIPSHIMLQNLGNPPVEPGWFYKFKAENDSTYHFVQVVDGNVTGARSLSPLGEDEVQLPIDIASVKLDSDAVFEQFRQRAPELGISVSDSTVYDLELVYLQSNPAPIWSVVTPDGSQWLYSLNAVTGEETKDPRA